LSRSPTHLVTIYNVLFIPATYLVIMDNFQSASNCYFPTLLSYSQTSGDDLEFITNDGHNGHGKHILPFADHRQRFLLPNIFSYYSSLQTTVSISYSTRHHQSGSHSNSGEVGVCYITGYDNDSQTWHPPQLALLLFAQTLAVASLINIYDITRHIQRAGDGHK